MWRVRADTLSHAVRIYEREGNVPTDGSQAATPAVTVGRQTRKRVPIGLFSELSATAACLSIGKSSVATNGQLIFGELFLLFYIEISFNE